MPRAWVVRNCFQVGPVRRGRRGYSGAVQDLPDGGGGDRVAEPDEFALHAAVSPGGIIGGDADHELADLG